jgi:hypothetical protein
LIKDIPVLLKEWDKLDESGKNVAAIRALCQTDLYYLLVKVCGRVDLLHAWTYQRVREVEALPNNHLDLWAREHGKSSIITFGLTIQDILNDPEITIGIFSQNGSIAEVFLNQIKREFENNLILKAVFPDIFYDNPSRESPLWSSQKGIIVKRKGNPKEATIESSGLVDSLPVGRHYKLLIYDDVVTSQSVSTAEQIQKTTEAYQLSLSLGSEGCNKRIIGTRYNFADTYDAILKAGVVKPRLYPATDSGEPDGNPVWMSIENWENKKKEVSSYVLSCQYLQNPLAGTERMFDVSDFEVYDIRPHSINVYIMVDPAKSKNKGSDATAIAVIGVDAAMNKYLLDGFNHKMDLQDRWKYTELMYRKWQRVPGVQSVKVGYEKFSAQADLDYFTEQMKLSNSKFTIEELAWTGEGKGGSSKIDRVQRLGPDLREHKIFLPYKTNEKKYTKAQQSMIDQGFGYRVARMIKKNDGEGNIYDLSEVLYMQAHYFPVGKKDLIDAVSRIYDLEPKPPIAFMEGDSLLLEPLYT